MLAYNIATGNHKLKLLATGKSKTPRGFKYISIAVVQMAYRSQNAWMKCEIFCDQFLDKFVLSIERLVTMLGLPKKAALLIYNAPIHPNVEDLRNGYIKSVLALEYCIVMETD